MRIKDSFIIAFATYSRIPMPNAEWNDENKRYSMCFFPLIGIVIGLLETAFIWISSLIGISAFLKGTICAALPILITGGIHMDGFMDTTDAMASWQPKEKRLEILKDTHVGAFAVIYCGLYLLISAGLYSELGILYAPCLCACFTASRALSALTMTLFKSARPNGMLDSFSRIAATKAIQLSFAVYALFCMLTWLFWGNLLICILCVCFSAISVFLYKHHAYKYFGGTTGDLAGWFLQVTELLLFTAVFIGGTIL